MKNNGWKSLSKKVARQAVSGITALAIVAGGALVVPETVNAISSDGVIKAKLPVHVLFNARKIKMPGGRAQLKDGSVFVPIRAVSETLGAKVNYSGKEVTIIKEETKIELTIGTKRVVVNGKVLTGIGASFVSSGSTMVPIRVISESFGEAVEWDTTNQFVWIGSKQVPKAEDVLKPLPVETSSDYYKGRENLLESFDNDQKVKLSEVLVIKEENLPLQIGTKTIYRIDRTSSHKGEEYIQTISNDFSTLGTDLVLLTSDGKARIRGRVNSLTQVSEPYKYQYYSILARTDSITLNDKNWEKLKWADVDYIQIRVDFKYLVIFESKL